MEGVKKKQKKVKENTKIQKEKQKKEKKGKEKEKKKGKKKKKLSEACVLLWMDFVVRTSKTRTPCRKRLWCGLVGSLNAFQQVAPVSPPKHLEMRWVREGYKGLHYIWYRLPFSWPASEQIDSLSAGLQMQARDQELKPLDSH